MRTLVLFESLGGNTEKVALAIGEALTDNGLSPHVTKVEQELELELYAYDLVFIGSPVIDWLPAPAMMDFARRTLRDAQKQGLILPAAPMVPGKFAVCFGTFAGPHIGEREAVPMTAWLRSFLEHLGFTVQDSWHVIGAFGDEGDLNRQMNTQGRLGDIRHRPHAGDLADVKNRVAGLLASLSAESTFSENWIWMP